MPPQPLKANHVQHGVHNIYHAHGVTNGQRRVTGASSTYAQPVGACRPLSVAHDRAAEFVIDYGLELLVYLECMSNAIESICATLPGRFFVIDGGVITFVSQPRGAGAGRSSGHP